MKDKNLSVETYRKTYFKTSVSLWMFLLPLSQIIVTDMGSYTKNNLARVSGVTQWMKVLIA